MIDENDLMEEVYGWHIAKGKPKPEYSTDFLIVRRAAFHNFISNRAITVGRIKEEDLTPHHIYAIIYEVGKYFLEHNLAGLEEIPEITE